jgi:hypothetical protein
VEIVIFATVVVYGGQSKSVVRRKRKLGLLCRRLRVLETYKPVKYISLAAGFGFIA